MNPGTASVVNVTDSLAERTNPAWSPDGSHLTFALTDSLVDHSIWTINADGSHPLRLTTAEEPSQYAPSWGP
jgi:Tol biopolymer transport system component